MPGASIKTHSEGVQLEVNVSTSSPKSESGIDYELFHFGNVSFSFYHIPISKGDLPYSN